MKRVRTNPEHARPTYFLRPAGLKHEIHTLKTIQDKRVAALRKAVKNLEANKNVGKAISDAKALMIALEAGNKKLTIRKEMHKKYLIRQKRGK